MASWADKDPSEGSQRKKWNLQGNKNLIRKKSSKLIYFLTSRFFKIKIL